jgi:hypothetical protein
MGTLKCSATVSPQLTSASREASVPFNFTSSFAQKALLEMSLAKDVEDQEIVPGSILSPQCIIIELYEGAIDIAFDVAGSAGTGLLKLNRIGTPTPENPAYFVYMNPVPTAKKLFVSTPLAAARFNIWYFQ